MSTAFSMQVSTCEKKMKKKDRERENRDRQGEKEMRYWMCLSEILARWMPTAE